VLTDFLVIEVVTRVAHPLIICNTCEDETAST
jgi:hypothetical protein